MARRPGKRPGARALPPDRKEPRTGSGRDPALHDRETMAWAFAIVDRDGPWGWRTVAARGWWSEILPKLQGFESMTWAEIMQAAGGRARGTNSHFVQVERLTRQAKDRLAEIHQDDVSELFSLRRNFQQVCPASNAVGTPSTSARIAHAGKMERAAPGTRLSRGHACGRPLAECRPIPPSDAAYFFGSVFPS